MFSLLKGAPKPVGAPLPLVDLRSKVEFLFFSSMWTGGSSSLALCLLSPKTALLKLLKEIITTVTLSRVLRSKEFLRMYSTAIPLCLCTFVATFSCLLSATLFQTQLTISSLDILSKMPSQPRTRKSWSVKLILKEVISGMATTTWGFPPSEVSFASMSPKVRDTDNLPGKTLSGPTMISLFSPDVWVLLGMAVRLKILRINW